MFVFLFFDCVHQVGEGVLGMEGVSCALEPTTPGLGYLSYSFTAKLTGKYKNYHLFVKVNMVYLKKETTIFL